MLAASHTQNLALDAGVHCAPVVGMKHIQQELADAKVFFQMPSTSTTRI